MEPIFLEKGLQLTIAERGGVAVLTDLDKLERILKNVISNALKYTEKGGVLLDYGKDRKEYFVEVRDTGMGIHEDEIPKIFKRFYRGRGTADKGVGIGLALVKELVDIMGGRIEVASKVSEGTSIKMWLPIRKS